MPSHAGLETGFRRHFPEIPRLRLFYIALVAMEVERGRNEIVSFKREAMARECPPCSLPSLSLIQLQMKLLGWAYLVSKSPSPSNGPLLRERCEGGLEWTASSETHRHRNDVEGGKPEPLRIPAR
jgi:hypothetical protein